jgi:hypothetical protein
MAEAMPDTPARVRAGLVALLAEPGLFPPRDVRVFRNLLLDHGGGDALPYVSLLLRALEWGVADRLPAGDPDRETWASVGGAIARDFAAAQLVVSEAARWAVDSWALALGLVSEQCLAPMPDDAPEPTQATCAASAPAASHDAATTRAAIGARTPAAPLAAPRVGGPGGLPRPAATTPPARRVAPPPAPVTGPTRQDVVRTFAGTALALLAVFTWTRLAATDRPVESPAPTEAPRAAMTGPPAATAPTTPAPAASAPVTSPRAASEPAASPAATPTSAAAAPATPTPPAPAPSARAVAASPIAFPAVIEDTAVAPRDDDEVVLRDGRRYRGTIALVTAAEVFVQDEWSGLPFVFPVGVLRELRTRQGRVLRYDTTAVATLAAVAPGPRMTDYGIGGRYQVQTQGATIDGTEECRSPAARASLAATRREVIAHARGSARFTLDSRPGVEGALEPDGRFVVPVTEGRSGTTRWAFAMSGRFTPAGFTATSVLVTETPLAWRRVQRCRVQADLVALRER